MRGKDIIVHYKYNIGMELVLRLAACTFSYYYSYLMYHSIHVDNLIITKFTEHSVIIVTVIFVSLMIWNIPSMMFLLCVSTSIRGMTMLSVC